MMFETSSIKKKLMGGMLLTSAAVLAVTAAGFLVYEVNTFRQTTRDNLSSVARVIAANSAAPLAFDNREDAKEVLTALATERHIVVAGLYDDEGALFASFAPTGRPVSATPPAFEGTQFTSARLLLGEPVMRGERRLGTLYLESTLDALYDRLRLYGTLLGGTVLVAGAVALIVATRLQRSISQPILALVDVASSVAERHDYSVRAGKFANDELGRLSDAFNEMLGTIQQQHTELHGQAERLREEVDQRRRVEQEVLALNASLERRVLERTAALESANKELEAFSYSVSHDLRAPLRAITGFSRILLDDHQSALPDEAAGYLRRVSAGAQRMGQLIDDLLTFSRLSRSALTRSRVDMARIVRDVLDELVTDERRGSVQIIVGELPACEGDGALLKQVYVNLVSNALKFTRNRPDARIEIGSAVDNGTRVYFVADNGAGFEMRYADKLFGVFQRLHRAEDYEGTGVGLAIVHRVISRHGGRVWAHSAPDEGARFSFTLGEQV